MMHRVVLEPHVRPSLTCEGVTVRTASMNIPPTTLNVAATYFPLLLLAPHIGPKQVDALPAATKKLIRTSTPGQNIRGRCGAEREGRLRSTSL